jgi:hypothetical protein
MAMAAMNMVFAGGFSGVSFHLRRYPQGVASLLCKKIPIFGSRRSKLDYLTVHAFGGGIRMLFIALIVKNDDEQNENSTSIRQRKTNPGMEL